MQLKWHKLYKVDYDLDKILIWARLLQLNSQGNKVKPYSSANGYMGHDQEYWLGEFPEEEFNYFNKFIPLDGTFKGTKTSCTLWEYQAHTFLNPHIHKDEKEIGGVLIVPLIGKFKTSVYNENREIVDSIEYAPGNIFFLKGKEYLHGGEAVDGYRLNVMLYIKKDTNLGLYI